MTTKLNTIKGTGATLTEAGWVINQTAYLDGLTSDGTAAGLISAAYTVLLSNGYYIGKFLNFADGSWPIVLDQMDFSTLTIDAQQVGLIWRSRRYSAMRVNFSTAGTMEQTNVDANGNVLTVEYTYPEGYPESQRIGTTEETGAIISKFVPEVTLDIARTEWGPTYGWTAGYDISHIIAIKKYNYEGKTNANSWYPIPGGSSIPVDMQYPASWLCTGINAVTNDSGVTYDVSYSFSYRKRRLITIGATQTTVNGWDTIYSFIDPSTGRPIPDPDESSMKVGVPYTSVDFSGIYG